MSARRVLQVKLVHPNHIANRTIADPLCCCHPEDGDYKYSPDVIIMLMMLKKHDNDDE